MELIKEPSTQYLSVILHIFDDAGKRKSIVQHKDTKNWELEYKEDGKYKHILFNTLEDLCINQNFNLNVIFERFPELITMDYLFK